MTKVLHLTAHLGGGVGKALSGLIKQAVSTGPAFEHTIITLEEQQKSQFIDQIRSCGCEVIECPSRELLRDRIMDSDIVQLEWWNHPATISALCGQQLPSMRLLVWSHVSGLYNPVIPPGLFSAAQQFLFTSACSFESKVVKSLPDKVKNHIGVVSSSGGFDGLPFPHNPDGRVRPVAGYIGSLNFAKLHPRYVDYLSAVTMPNFRVKLIGDVTNREVLEHQCRLAGKPSLLEFRGYTEDIVSELSAIDILAYLLNPGHYGTTENALIEAMAMGIVPIVLNNPAERHIIDDRITGLIVNSPLEFAEAIAWLTNNPAERNRISINAAESVRERFTAKRMVDALNGYYGELLMTDKKTVSFPDIFGKDPADWFLTSQGNAGMFSEEGDIEVAFDDFLTYGLFEETKGTVFHFHKYFPDDKRLAKWSAKLISLQ